MISQMPVGVIHLLVPVRQEDADRVDETTRRPVQDDLVEVCRTATLLRSAARSAASSESASGRDASRRAGHPELLVPSRRDYEGEGSATRRPAGAAHRGL